jgi:hypothetical protein
MSVMMHRPDPIDLLTLANGPGVYFMVPTGSGKYNYIYIRDKHPMVSEWIEDVGGVKEILKNITPMGKKEIDEYKLLLMKVTFQ